jgi:hypothetical protein
VARRVDPEIHASFEVVGDRVHRIAGESLGRGVADERRTVGFGSVDTPEAIAAADPESAGPIDMD